MTKFFPQIDTSWESVWMPPKKGELVHEVHDRCGEVLDTMWEAMKHRHPDGHECILLVSHAATIIALTRALAGDRKLYLRVGCCSLTEFVNQDGAEGEKAGWQPVKLASGDHLAEGASRDWGFEDIIVDPETGMVIEDHGTPGTENDADHPVGRLFAPPAAAGATQSNIARM